MKVNPNPIRSMSSAICLLTFTLQPKAISETEDTDLAAMMADAAKANAEVSGDDSEDED
jgi:hypothetical protein